MAAFESVCHVSVAGDHNSAESTPRLTTCPSNVVPPPVISTLPSGSTVEFWNAREYAIEASWRQEGFDWVMSSTYAVAAALPVVPLSAAVPVFRILPGRYITELWPSLTIGSMVDQR